MNLLYTPLSSSPLLLNSYYLSTSHILGANTITSYLSYRLPLTLDPNVSNDPNVELNGASTTDLVEWFHSIDLVVSNPCSVNVHSLTTSYLDNPRFLFRLVTSLYVNSFNIHSFSLSVNIHSE